MDKRNDVKEKLTNAFEMKHKDFLMKLEQMPVGSEEDREQRWTLFKKYPLSDEFQLELMQAYGPGAYRKLLERMNAPHVSFDGDWGLVSYLNDEMDWTIFCEAVREAICTYTGINKHDKGYTFLSAVGKLYKNKAWREKAGNMMKEKGIPDAGIPEKRKPYIIKLFCKAKEIREREFGSESLKETFLEEILKKALEDLTEQGKNKSYIFSKNERELVRRLLVNERISISIDMPMDEEAGTLENLLQDEQDMYQEVLNRETNTSFLEVFCCNIEDNWDAIKAARNLREREFIKIFFTRDVLKTLKLDADGKPYLEEPAGDEEVYQSLEQRGDFLYGKVFYKEYLRRAFEKYPNDFYSVYAKLLRRDFNFTDRMLAEVSRKDAGSISRQRNHYRELMKIFYDYYVNSD